MSFLKAEWRKLAFVNYAVDPKVLQEYIPYGTKLDLWEDQCFLSLVGFRFINTKLLGLKIPFHTNFEEVNLRFYVKRKTNNEWRRGVVFIKEIVPKPALTFVANTLYQENYETMPMKHVWNEHLSQIEVSYHWQKEGKWNSFQLEGSNQLSSIDPGSNLEFITEHYWGYAKINESKSNEYEVTHPKWQTYPIEKYKLNVNFAATYGNHFGFLNNQKPASVMLAEGSQITVENKTTIT